MSTVPPVSPVPPDDDKTVFGLPSYPSEETTIVAPPRDISGETTVVAPAGPPPMAKDPLDLPSLPVTEESPEPPTNDDGPGGSD